MQEMFISITFKTIFDRIEYKLHRELIIQNEAELTISKPAVVFEPTEGGIMIMWNRNSFQLKNYKIN